MSGRASSLAADNVEVSLLPHAGMISLHQHYSTHQLIVQPCALHCPDHERLPGTSQQLCWAVHIPTASMGQRANLCLVCPESVGPTAA
jgi:hypothetical protein